MGSRRTAVLVALGVALVLALGTSAGTARNSTTRDGGTLRVAVGAGLLPTLDPAVGAMPLGWGALWYATCSTLMAFRDAPAPDGFTVRPEAAVGAPEVSRDGRTYVFTVHKGLRFSDGSPLTARNFAYALSRVLSPGMRSPGASVFSDVRRVTPSGRRLRIELRKPSADLPTRLALPFSCPVPLNLPIDPAGVPLVGVGSGPYRVASYETGKLLVLERNSNYRGDRPHRVDRVVVTFDASISAIEQGLTDALGVDILPFELRDSLAQRYGVNKSQFFRLFGNSIYFLVLNTSRPLFRGNVALRKAVNLALDRTEIAKAGGAGWPLSHQPTDQILTHWARRWVDHDIYPLAAPNLQRAQNLAAPNLRGGKAALYASQLPFLVEQADVIAQQLSRIGLDVTVKPISPDVIPEWAGTRGAPYDMLLTRYFLFYPDPAEVMIRLLAGTNASKSAGNTNLAYFDNPTFNRRMAEADRLTGASRVRAFSDLDAAIMRDAAPWAPLYEGSATAFISTRVGCLRLHPVFRLDLAAMCVQ